MQTIERTITSEEQRRQFAENGYIVVRGLLAPEEVAALRDTFMAQAAHGPVEGLSDGHRKLSPDEPLARYPRMMHPHRHPELPVGPLSMRYMLDHRFEAVLSGLFGEQPLAAQSMFYFKPPGARGQDLHQDNFYLRVKPGTCIAAWVAIDDADQENGGMVVVPGSNQFDIACPERADNTIFFTTEHVPVPAGYQEEPIDLKAGDVLFFNGSVIHGSYPNTSRDRFRRAFICHYVPRGSAEVSHWYRPLLTFDGEDVEMADATGGGPCGTVADVKGPH
jgi:phytanoyl-CoA hydroxylase